MKNDFIVLLIVTSSLGAGVARAQEPFSRVTISAGGAHNINHVYFHNFWKPGYGGELTFSTPFHLGAFETGVVLHRYDAAVESVPRFDAVLAFLGWGAAVSPIDVISWYTGLRVGTYRMAFDEETFAGIRTESELTLGLNARIDVRVTREAGIYVAGRYARTFTAKRLDLAYVSGGLSLTLDSPAWLRTILR